MVYAVPLVPRLIVRIPGSTLPVPIAPYILSPEPASILHSESNPYFSTKYFDTTPMLLTDDSTLGNLSIKFFEILLIIFSDHLLFTGSHSPVPEASPSSMVILPPVKYQLIKLCTKKKQFVSSKNVFSFLYI